MGTSYADSGRRLPAGARVARCRDPDSSGSGLPSRPRIRRRTEFGVSTRGTASACSSAHTSSSMSIDGAKIRPHARSAALQSQQRWQSLQRPSHEMLGGSRRRWRAVRLRFGRRSTTRSYCSASPARPTSEQIRASRRSSIGPSSSASSSGGGQADRCRSRHSRGLHSPDRDGQEPSTWPRIGSDPQRGPQPRSSGRASHVDKMAAPDGTLSNPDFVVRVAQLGRGNNPQAEPRKCKPDGSYRGSISAWPARSARSRSRNPCSRKPNSGPRPQAATSRHS